MSTARSQSATPSLAPSASRPELQRVPLADGLSPIDLLATEVDHAAGPHAAPLTLLWHARRVDRAAPGQFRLTVPVVGGPPARGASRRLNHLLHQQWRSMPGYEGPRIRTALAVFTNSDGPAPEADCALTLLLTTDPALPGDASIDGTPLASHLSRVLHVLGT